jgi:hypothetical protein
MPDPNEIARQIVQFLAPFLPYLLKAGEKAAEEAGRKLGAAAWEQAQALWARLRRKKNVEQVAQTVAALPDNQALREALREEIARALAEDPALAQEMTRLVAQISASERGVAAQTIENSTVTTGDRNAVFGPGATGTITVITGTVQQLSITGGPSAPAHARTTTLPARAFFVGRARELEAIAQALSPEARTWGALIDGPGGIGKTALAVEAAHRAPETLFERKIFITAKVRQLTPEGEKPLTDFTRPDYLAMLNELALALGEEGIPKLPPEERPNALRRALTGKKVLIVFDNVETLPEDERTRLFQFLGFLPQGNKAIVTSRRRTDVDARIIRLDRLSRDEALQLIAHLAERNPRLARASQQEREDLYEITQGNPLLIHWIAGQLGREGSQCRTIAEACAFIEQAPPGNDPLEYIFGDLLETCTENETKVLAALTHFTQPVRPQWIAQMTGLPERAAATALEDLTDRSILISDPESRAFFLPSADGEIHPHASPRSRDPDWRRAYGPRLRPGDAIRWLRQLRRLPHAGRRMGTHRRRPAAPADGRQCPPANGVPPTQPVSRLHRPLGRVALALRTSRSARPGGGRQRERRLAGLSGGVGVLSPRPGRRSAGLRRPRRRTLAGERAAPESDCHPPARTRPRIEKRLPRRHRRLPRSAGHLPRPLPRKRRCRHRAERPGEAWNASSKDYAAAERDYREALRIAKKIKDDEGTAIYTGNLAALALDREQWAEAETLAREALALAEKVGRQELIASDCPASPKPCCARTKPCPRPAPSPAAPWRFTRACARRLQSAQATLAEIEQALDAS